MAQPESSGLAPIEVHPEAKFEKDFLREEREWAQRCLILPAAERWKGFPWAKEALALAEEAFEIERLEAPDEGDLGVLAPRFKKLLLECGDDDLLQVLAASAIHDENKDWRASRPHTLPLLARAAKMPAPLEMRLLRLRSWEANLEGATNGMTRQAFQACLTRMLSDPSYDEASESVLVRHTMAHLRGFADPKDAEQAQLWLAAIQASPRSDWLKKVLEGDVEIRWAWLERGTAYADKTTKAQWQGFRKHLVLAREALAQAHQMRPDRPEAAARMITVVMGESGFDYDQIRHWFDNATRAQFDYFDAYQAVLQAMLPRWGGSHEIMLAFGARCAETRRYDTAVPSRLLIAGVDVAEDLKVPPSFFSADRLREAMAEMVKGYLKQESQPPAMRHRRVSDGAFAAWMCSDYALAKEALELAGPKLHVATRNKLAAFDLHEAAMRSSIHAGSGHYGADIQRLSESKDLATAHSILSEIAPAKLSPDARAYFTEAKMLAEFPKRFQQGTWIPLQYGKHLNLFTSDHWTIQELDKSLSIEGRDWFQERSFLRMPMTANFELRGEFSLELPHDLKFSADGCGVGLVLWPKPGGTPVYLMFYHSSAGVSTVKAFATDEKQAPPVRFVSYRRQNPFSFRFVDGKVSYDLNGERMSGAFKLGDFKKAENPELKVGFELYRLPIGAKASFRNLSIRKISANDLEPPIQPITQMTQPMGAPLALASATLAPAIDLPHLMIQTGKWLALAALLLMLIGLMQSRRESSGQPGG